MRQRGVQSRRGKSGLEGAAFGAPLGSGGGRDRFWPTVAMIAIVVATAGWTTVAVLALSGSGGASPSPSQIADAGASQDDTSFAPDESDSPEPDSHVAPDLEALLPKSVDGTALTSQSWTGDTLLSDDGWSTAFSTFLQSVGKNPTDLVVAQAYDPDAAIDLTVAAFKISGITAADIRKTLVTAWKADYPELTTTSVTVSGKKVTKGVFQDTGIDSYWYEHDDLVYDVETADADVAAKTLALLP